MESKRDLKKIGNNLPFMSIFCQLVPPRHRMILESGFDLISSFVILIFSLYRLFWGKPLSNLFGSLSGWGEKNSN